MGTWYLIGLLVGIGVALGVLFVGMLGAARQAALAALVLAAAVAVGVGLGVERWPEAVGGGLGALAGVAGAWQIVSGALRRGGTRGGTAVLVGGAALLLAALAFVPALGYVEALALPALGARLRSRAAQRYAGLRILARD
jgi:hypothetical protein